MWMLFIRAPAFVLYPHACSTRVKTFVQMFVVSKAPASIVREQLLISVSANSNPSAGDGVSGHSSRSCIALWRQIVCEKSSNGEKKMWKLLLLGVFYITVLLCTFLFVFFFPLCMLCCTGCYITNHIFLIYKIIKMTVCTEGWFVWTGLGKDQTCWIWIFFLLNCI